MVQTHQVTQLPNTILPRRQFDLTRISSGARHQCSHYVRILTPNRHDNIRHNIVTTNHRQPTGNLTVNVLPFMTIRFTPLPNLIVTTRLTITDASHHHRATHRSHQFIFFLQNTHIIPRQTIFTDGRIVNLHHMKRLTINNGNLPHQTTFQTRFIRRGLLNTFLRRRLMGHNVNKHQTRLTIRHRRTHRHFTDLTTVHFQRLISYLFR